MQSFPYRLYQKAKRYGVWNPEDIDFEQDRKDWERFTEEQKAELLAFLSIFLAGEEAVTIELLPLMHAIAREGRLEEEMYLTTFLFEEAKHTEFFRLLLNELGETDDLTHLLEKHSPTALFLRPTEDGSDNILSRVMNRLLTDSSPKAFADAALAYNIILEGVAAEGGYWYFERALGRKGYMPGLMKGIQLIKTDESRHISYGTYLLHRLIAENPDLYEYAINKIDEWLPVQEIPDHLKNATSAFGISGEERWQQTLQLVNVRKQILKKATEMPIHELYASDVAE